MNELSTTQAESLLAQHADQFRKNIKVNSSYLAVTKTGRFRLADSTEVDNLDVVILDYVYRNQYYPTIYNPANFQPPICQAIGKASNDHLVPIENISPTQQADTCSACPKNQWGSSPTGRGRACQNQLLLAVMLPDPEQDETVMVVKASPTALKKIAPYLLKTVDLYGHPVKVVSNLIVDMSAGFPRLEVKFVSTNPLWDRHVQYLKDAERSLFAGTDSPEPVEDSAFATRSHTPAYAEAAA